MVARDYNAKTTFNWQTEGHIPKIGKLDCMKECLADIQEILDICHENKIELIIFSNPMYYVTYAASLEQDYFGFLEHLAHITDFWNFSSLNNITLNNANYHETSHYRAEVGDMMLNVMCSGEVYPELQAQGFGVKVTRENVKDFIAMLRKQAEDFRHKNSPVP